MNKQSGIGKTLTGVLAVVCWIGFSMTAQAQADKNVRMEVSENEDELVINTPNNENGCPWYKPRGNGCLKADKGNRLKINMILQGEAKCTREHVDPDTKWELNAVYLGGFNAPDKPANFGFTNTPDADYQKVKSDFDVADRATGRVNPEMSNDRLIKVKDDNQFKYVVWYKVEAKCERNDGQPPYYISTDPRVRNGGN